MKSLDDKIDGLERLKYWLGIQSGLGEAITEEDENRIESGMKKIKWGPGSDFGSQVRIAWRFEDGSHSWKDVLWGYLCAMPFDEGEPFASGIVHVPHVPGDKCDAGAEWITLVELALNPNVTRVDIETSPVT